MPQYSVGTGNPQGLENRYGETRDLFFDPLNAEGSARRDAYLKAQRASGMGYDAYAKANPYQSSFDDWLNDNTGAWSGTGPQRSEALQRFASTSWGGIGENANWATLNKSLQEAGADPYKYESALEARNKFLGDYQRSWLENYYNASRGKAGTGFDYKTFGGPAGGLPALTPGAPGGTPGAPAPMGGAPAGTGVSMPLSPTMRPSLATSPQMPNRTAGLSGGVGGVAGRGGAGLPSLGGAAPQAPQKPRGTVSLAQLYSSPGRG